MNHDLAPEQEALLAWVMGIFESPIDPDKAPTPQAYMLARTLADFARLLAPQARDRVRRIPPSAARSQLVAIAHSAVARIGLRVCEEHEGVWRPVDSDVDASAPFASLLL